MAYQLHRGGDQRYVLQSPDTGALVGLMLQPLPGESPQAFGYDFGPVYDRRELLNLGDFPELADLTFFAIEYLGFHDFDRYLHSPDWQALHPFLAAEGKAIGYNARRDKPVPTPLPPLWQHTPPNPAGLWKVPAWALWVNAQGCWLGNRDGLVLALDQEGNLMHQHHLGKTGRCLVGDDRHLYASCDDGQIYELSGKLLQAVYNARTAHVPPFYDFWLPVIELYQGQLFVLDGYGLLTALRPDQNDRWQVRWRQQTATRRGWWLRADSEALYHGHNRGVTCYHLQTGKVLWEQGTIAPVLCGDLTPSHIAIGTSDGRIYALDRNADCKTRQTEIHLLATCASAVYACAWSGDGCLLAADQAATLYGFGLGDNLAAPVDSPAWRHWLNCGAVLNLRQWGDRLYAATTDGSLACFSLAAVSTFQSAPLPGIPVAASAAPVPVPAPQRSHRQKPKRAKSATQTTDAALPATSEPGVWVECFQQGSKLKVRAISPGYHPDWNVQFPQHLRQAGARYRVDALAEAKQGGFYRVVGEIQQT